VDDWEVADYSVSVTSAKDAWLDVGERAGSDGVGGFPGSVDVGV